MAVIAGEFGDDLKQSGALVFYWLAVAVEPGLVLGAEHGHSGFQVWQAVSDVVHEQPAEGLGQVARAGPGGDGGVVALQEGLLVPQTVLQALLGVDVMLAPIGSTNQPGRGRGRVGRGRVGRGRGIRSTGK